jgi:hypothetical protein
MSRLLRKWWFLASLVVLFGITGGIALSTPRAHAQFGAECPAGPIYLGRAPCYMYFSGQYRQAPSGADSVMLRDGILAGIDFSVQPSDKNGNKKNADAYMKVLLDDLNSGDLMNEVGAATIVDVMLGKNGPDFGNSRDAGIAFARDPANFNRLSDLVHQYAAKGLIEWSHSTSSDGLDGTRVKHMVHDPVLQDSFMKSTPFYVANTIRFASVNGSEPFEVESDCGNLFGYTGGLVGTPPHGDVNPPTPPGGGGTPPGFNTGNPDLNSSCQYISGHAADPSDANFKVPITVTYQIQGGPSGSLAPGFADNTSPNLFKIPTNAAIQTSVNKITITVLAKDSSGNPFSITGSPIQIGPCRLVQGACQGASTIPASPDPGQKYSLSAAIHYDSVADATLVRQQPDFKFYVKVTGPNGKTTYTYDNNNVGGIPNPPTSNNIAVLLKDLPATGSAGVYIISYGITAAIGTVNCGTSASSDGPGNQFNVVNKPYFQVTKGDISAGAAISPAGGLTCAATPPTPNSGSIVSWNMDPANGDYGGAGTQYAAFALNHLQEFTTAQGSGGGPKAAAEPSGLAFANSGIGGSYSPTNGLYGGKLGGSDCIADYFSGATAGNTLGATTVSAILAGIPGYGGGGVVPNGSRTTKYINGDLHIDSDVAFTGAYGGIGDIPVFAVVVKGNIYIDPSVKRLDGIYVAQPSAATPGAGVIYTCVPSGYSGVAVSLLNKNLPTNCDQQLVVNGAFIGRQVWLLRAAGTVSSGVAAEVFNYSPELWLSAPFSSTGNVSQSPYNAITSLPPVL